MAGIAAFCEATTPLILSAHRSAICDEEPPQHHDADNQRERHKDCWTAQRLPQSARVALVHVIGLNARLQAVVELPNGRIVLADLCAHRFVFAGASGRIEPHGIPLIGPQRVELGVVNPALY